MIDVCVFSLTYFAAALPPNPGGSTDLEFLKFNYCIELLPKTELVSGSRISESGSSIKRDESPIEGGGRGYSTADLTP